MCNNIPNIIEQLKSDFDCDAIKLPLEWDGRDLHDTLNTVFDKAKKELGKTPFYQADLYGNLTSGVLDVVKYHLAGALSKAYVKFNNMMKPLREKLLTTIHKKGEEDLNSQRLFRLRQANKIALTKSEIFHIPFEERHNVRSQRYSIPGLPCLYLGGSVYTCWRELGSPDLNVTLHVSRYECIREMKFVDISVNPYFYIKHSNPRRRETFLESYSDHFKNSMELWPLIAACSIKVCHQGAPFKPEYIIPQMLLEWTKNNGLDGVRYFSTHISGEISSDDPHWGCNFAIPVQTSETKGYCQTLKTKLRLTQPQSWTLLQQAKEQVRFEDHFTLNLSGLRSISYYSTEFGIAQNLLLSDTSTLEHPI